MGLVMQFRARESKKSHGLLTISIFHNANIEFTDVIGRDGAVACNIHHHDTIAAASILVGFIYFLLKSTRLVRLVMLAIHCVQNMSRSYVPIRSAAQAPDRGRDDRQPAEPIDMKKRRAVPIACDSCRRRRIRVSLANA